MQPSAELQREIRPVGYYLRLAEYDVAVAIR
jgi:hypothetical protein